LGVVRVEVGGVPLRLLVVRLGDVVFVRLALFLVLLLQLLERIGGVVLAFAFGVGVDHRDGADHLAPIGRPDLEAVQLDRLATAALLILLFLCHRTLLGFLFFHAAAVVALPGFSFLSLGVARPL